MAKGPRHVILVGLSHGGLDVQMIKGINTFRHNVSFWVLHNAGHDRHDFDKLLENEQRTDGILANVTDWDFAEKLLRLNIPVVDVSGMVHHPDIPCLYPDHQAIGQEAAEYFISRGYKHLAFSSSGAASYELGRWQGYARVIREHQCHGYWIRVSDKVVLDENNELIPIEESWQRFARWMEYLPKPLAVLASFDGTAVDVCDRARELGIAVPEQVAILGVDNAEMTCQMCQPPLSSVRVPGERIGYEAAALLDKLMQGIDGVPPPPFKPMGIETRKSTDVTAIDDVAVASAVAYMKQHAKDKVTVDEVAEASGVQRRVLEKRFAKVLGRSPLNELFRIRVEIAKQRLLDTDASIYVTAIESGFRDAESLAKHFKRWAGMPPSAYRKQNRMI